jgi:hypothetical protein
VPLALQGRSFIVLSLVMLRNNLRLSVAGNNPKAIFGFRAVSSDVKLENQMSPLKVQLME